MAVTTKLNSMQYDVLEYLNVKHEMGSGAKLQEISESTGLPIVAVSETLDALHSKIFVVNDDSGEYSITAMGTQTYRHNKGDPVLQKNSNLGIIAMHRDLLTEEQAETLADIADGIRNKLMTVERK